MKTIDEVTKLAEIARREKLQEENRARVIARKERNKKLKNLAKRAEEIYTDIVKSIKSDARKGATLCVYKITIFTVTNDNKTLAELICKKLRGDGFRADPRIIDDDGRGIDDENHPYCSLVVDVRW